MITIVGQWMNRNTSSICVLHAGTSARGAGLAEPAKSSRVSHIIVENSAVESVPQRWYVTANSVPVGECTQREVLQEAKESYCLCRSSKI